VSTGLDQCLIERWRDTAGLNSLIPVKLVGTEVIQTNETIDSDDDKDGHFDDCVVLQVATEPHWRTNSGRGWKSQVKVSVMSIDYDRGKAVAQRCETLWDSNTFTGSESVISFCRSSGISSEQDESTGIWDSTVSFEIQHNGV
jgi:hypothetical protein